MYLEYKTLISQCSGKVCTRCDIISDLKKQTDIWAGLNIGFLNKGQRLLDAWSTTNP